MRWYRESLVCRVCVQQSSTETHHLNIGTNSNLESSVMFDFMWQLFLLVYTAGKQQMVSGQKAGKKFTGMSMMTDAETAAAADLSAEQHRTASMFLSGSQPAACIGQLSRR